MHSEIIFIGLGRMGGAMVARLTEADYTVHTYDVSEDARIAAKATGAKVYDSYQDTIAAVKNSPKVVWLMVPAQYVDSVLDEITPTLSAGDIVIDGGNSFFKDSLRRHTELEQAQIHFIDVGTSGGVEGARHGASLMIGGDQHITRTMEPLFKTLAIENGYGFAGGPGAGHFVKMIHNGIEYGMMGAIAEGVATLESHQEGLDIDIMETLKAYGHGSIIDSSLLHWLSDAYKTKGYLDGIAGTVPKGETEMEMEYIDSHANTPVLHAAIEQRKNTRTNPSRTGTLLAAMRNQFGGHATLHTKK